MPFINSKDEPRFTGCAAKRLREIRARVMATVAFALGSYTLSPFTVFPVE